MQFFHQKLRHTSASVCSCSLGKPCHGHYFENFSHILYSFFLLPIQITFTLSLPVTFSRHTERDIAQETLQKYFQKKNVE